MSHVVIKTGNYGTGTITVDGVDISNLTRSVYVSVAAGGRAEVTVELAPGSLEFEGEAEVSDSRQVVLRFKESSD